MRAGSCRVVSPHLERVLEALHADRGNDWDREVVSAVHDAVVGSTGVCLVVEDHGTQHTVSAPESSHEAPRSGFHLRRARRLDADLEMVLLLSFARPFDASPHERAVLRKLTLHLENALRLRYRPAQVLAFAEHGVLCWQPGRPPLPAAAVWAALESGTFTFTTLGTRRALLEAHAPHRALTTDERDALRCCLSGMSSKAIGAELGLSHSSVSRLLAGGLTKLGLVTLADLLELASALTASAPVVTTLTKLTVAERSIFGLVRRGLSNVAIAQLRSSSTRTVANQMQGLLRKTGCASRRALAAVRVVDGGNGRVEVAHPH